MASPTSQRLTLSRLPLENLKHKPGRTATLVVVVTLLSLVFFAGSMLTINLESGLSSMQKRMGADLMIVPEGAKEQAESVLKGSCPQTFYFKREVLSQIQQVRGVGQISPQTFISSLNAGCCQARLQIIGFDPETDFVIQPWIDEQFHERLQDGQLIVGSRVHPSSDGKVRLFRHRFPVAAQLAPTGTSYDNSVFVNPGTIKLMRDYSASIGQPTIKESDVDVVVSNILIDVKEGFKAEKVAERIMKIPGLEKVGVIYPTGLASQVKHTMDSITTYVWAFLGIFWLTGVVILFAVFSASVNERKKELSSMRIMGAKRSTLLGMLVKEAAVVGLAGGLVGVGLAALFIFPFSDYIRSMVNLPYLPAGSAISVGLGVACVLCAVVVSVLAAVVAAVRVLDSETYLTLREGD